MTILVVDDQAAVRTALEVLFDVHDLPCEAVATPKEALDRVRAGGVSVVVQDMNFSANQTSGAEGVALFRALRQLSPGLPVVLLTAWSSLETAITLVKEGAADYLEKPWNDDKLLATVKNLSELSRLTGENRALRAAASQARAELEKTHDLRGLVYASDAMHRVVALAVQIARADVPVLITGPNGAGKEKLAEIVQAASRRKDKPFVRVNAGALPDNLLEAELFGAEAGAFTGAQKLRVGRFESADGGTLFLDEIGNLSLSGQMKLLRVLQTGELQRLGSNVTRKVDVRVISATNVDLQRAIEERAFREDLYFRLNVIELRVPPLAERRDDVLPLAERFVVEFAEEAGEGPAPALADDARRALLAHPFSGNVRELRNRVQRAVLLCQDGVVHAADLDLDGARAPRSSVASPARSEPTSREIEVDRASLEALLERLDFNISKAAAELGLSRQALYRRMERAGVSLERKVKK
ncbi:MAG: sigma-54-dependent Fis family transcriptional regulator [Myxococcales bacterium]|nr:sigma-54-dependent Fis family transcriptional regulator [Myxococcales bacterium]